MLGVIRRQINYTTIGRVGEARFRIPVWGGMEVRGIHETHKTHVIRRYSGDTRVFVDVGVNLGQTLLDLRASHPDVPYVGFEPNPRAVAYVQKLIEANRFDACDVVCTALSDHTGTHQLHSIPGDVADPSSTLIRNLRPHGKQTAVQPVVVVPFDAVALSLALRPVGFVKVDVEGAELEVLRGMRGTLREDRPPVYCEVLPRCGGATEEEAATRRAALLHLLTEIEYTAHHVGTDGSLQRTREFPSGPYRRDESWDYLLLPRERLL